MDEVSNVLNPLHSSILSFLNSQDEFHNKRLAFLEYDEDFNDEYMSMQDAEEKLRHALKWPHKGPDLRLAKQVKTMLEKQNIFFAFRQTAKKQGFDVKIIGKQVFKEWITELNKVRKRVSLSKLTTSLEEIESIYS